MLGKFVLFALAVAPIIAGQNVPWKAGSLVTSPAIVVAGGEPIAVNQTGKVFVGNNLVGTTAPTGTIGSTSPSSAEVSAVSSAGNLFYALRIYHSYAINAISADSYGDAYISGTASDSGFFITAGAYSSSFTGDGSAWVCKLDLAGGLSFCTYLNSNQLDIQSIATDPAGDVYVLALNQVSPPTVPQGAVALGDGSALLYKLSADGSKLLWTVAFTAVAIGGEPLAVDAAGNAYAPATGPAGQNVVAVINSAGSAITYLPLDQGDQVSGIAVDGSGGVYVAGQTAVYNTFVAKYAGGARVYQTSVSGDELALTSALAVDTSGVATVVENYPFADFPERQPTAQCTASGGAVMVRVSTTGEVLQSTFLGVDMYPDAVAATTTGGYVAGGINAPALGLLPIVPDTSGSAVSSIGCVGNSANLKPGAVAAGEIVSIFGDGLGPAVAATAPLTARIGSSLGGAEITFDDHPAPLFYAQNSQLEAIVPWEVGGNATTLMCATYTASMHCITLPLAAAAPAIFTSPTGYAVALNQDGSLNSPSKPANQGDTITLYLNGLGPLTPAPADGAIVQPPLPRLVDSVEVWFGYPSSDPFTGTAPVEGKIISAGPVPFGVAGLDEIRVQIPVTTAIPSTVLVNVVLPGGTTVQSSAVNVAID